MNSKLKTIVVIGGDRGIGAATATLAAQKGYQVVIGFYQQALTAQSKVQELKDIGASCCAFQIDVSNLRSVEMFFEQVVDSFGIPDAMVNCAAISGQREALIDTKPESIGQILSTNLTGAFYCVQVASKHMATSRGGRGGAIVTLSSEAAKFGGNLIAPYAASKAGINAMTIGVARELALEGIRLNAVSPGLVNSKLEAATTTTSESIGMTVAVQSIPLGRMGLPAEVAQAVLWLLSSDASYVTGTIFKISGGR
jgi:NAD(P)-dependent dehydrogenase (short-subunit alcohol dehydrogenase family)